MTAFSATVQDFWLKQVLRPYTGEGDFGHIFDGVNAHDDAQNCLLSGLTCRGNARSGISIGGSSRVEVSSCLLGSNGAAQLRSEGHCVVDVKGCDLLGDEHGPSHRIEGGRVSIDGKRVVD